MRWILCTVETATYDDGFNDDSGGGEHEQDALSLSLSLRFSPYSFPKIRTSSFLILRRSVVKSLYLASYWSASVIDARYSTYVVIVNSLRSTSSLEEYYELPKV